MTRLRAANGLVGAHAGGSGGKAAPTSLRHPIWAHCLKRAMPSERTLGRSFNAWFDTICNYHPAKVTIGPTEAINNLIKRIKRIGLGFRNFENWRIRTLLYAGRPNWRVLGSIVVR